MDFLNMDANTIATGVDSNGVKYLQSFLTEYTKLFPGTVNPGCNKCLQDYVTKYKKAMLKNELHPENSGFKLKAKYEGIPLEFGSQIFVTNANLTDEYAKKLLSHEDGERFFETIVDLPELDGREKLQADYDNSLKALDELPENVHHATKKKADKAVQEAKEALEKYDDEHPIDVEENVTNANLTDELTVTDAETVE